jgi:GT2 family glycosyltransferase
VAVCQPMVYLMKHPKQLNLTGKVTHFLGFDWVRDYKRTIIPRGGEIMSFSGCGVMIKKSVFTITKAFDQNYFMYYEDSDLSWRLRLFGYRLLFVPSAIMYHDYKYIPVERYQSLKSKLFYNERNRIMTLYKNYSTRTMLLLLPMAIVMECCMVVYALFGGWFIEKIRGYSSIIQLRNTLQKNRVFVQKNRIVSDKEITRDFMSTLHTELYNNIVVKYVINPLLFCCWGLVKHLI